MPTDCDLVILGGTLAGRSAAKLAATYGARVALIEPPGLFVQNQQQRYLLQGLQQLGQTLAQLPASQWMQPSAEEAERDEHMSDSLRVNWPALLEWSAISADTQFEQLSPAALNASGVDVILELPQDITSRGIIPRLSRHSLSQKMVVSTATRQLRARAVLAAFGRSPDVLKPLVAAEQLPASLTIWGGGGRSVLWAEALSQLGVRVTLQTAQVLPTWDTDIQRLMAAQLLAAGVEIVDPARRGPLPATPEITPETAPEPTLFFGTEQPALQLPARFYQPSERPYLTANRRLQTRHARLFACGAVQSGLVDEALAAREAAIAVNNALFLPRRAIDYPTVARGSHCFARVGLTQSEARRRYGNTLQIWTGSDPNSTHVTQAVPLPSYCKLVCSGEQLLGIHLFGQGASELIQPLASALGQPATRLSGPIEPSPARGLVAAISSAASQARRHRWRTGHWRRDWAENWFNWRRSR